MGKLIPQKLLSDIPNLYETEGAISDWGMCDGKTILKLKEPMDINATLMCNPYGFTA